MNCMIPTPCIFWQSIPQPRNALNKNTTHDRIKLLHVSAPEWHPQGLFFRAKQYEPNKLIEANLGTSTLDLSRYWLFLRTVTFRIFKQFIGLPYLYHKQYWKKTFFSKFSTNWSDYLTFVGTAVAQLVEALCYKPKGSGFDSRWCHWNWHNPSGRTVALGSTQPQTEMSIRNISWG